MENIVSKFKLALAPLTGQAYSSHKWTIVARLNGATMVEIKIYNLDDPYFSGIDLQTDCPPEESEFVFVAGQVSVDVTSARDFLAQCRQVYSNIAAALHALDCT